MKRFQFRLARLARVRALQEEQARAEWQAAEQEARAAEARTARATADRDTARGLLADDLSAGALGPGEVMLAHGQLDRMDREIRQRREVQVTARFQADQARAPWEERRRDVRALERLEERARDDHHREAEAAEAQTLDEVASTRAARKNQRNSSGDLS